MVGTHTLCGIQPLYKSARSPHIDINETVICVSQKVKNYVSLEKKEMQLCYMPTYNMHNQIMITYNNVGSLHHKCKAIQNSHNMQGSHVIFVAETWLSPQQNQNTTILKDFCQY